MSMEVAVETVRQWHLTVCHDLCLPPIPIIVKRSGGDGRAGRFWGQRTQAPSGFVAVDFNGLIVGGPVGGGVTTTCGVAIFEIEGYTERNYLYTLAHELRHAWQFVNSVPPTEEDCDQYAERFLNRFASPDSPRYTELVDEREYAAVKYQRELEAAKNTKRVFAFIVFAASIALACCGLYQLTWQPRIGSGGDMFRTIEDAQPAIHAAKTAAAFLFSFAALLAGIGLFGVFTADPRQPKPAKAKVTREDRLQQQRVAYAAALKNHPDNGKDGQWEVCGCLVTAKSAQEAIEKVAAAGMLDREDAVPKYRGRKRETTQA